MTKIISGQKARQGNNGRQMLIVLVAAMLLAAAVWAGVEFYGEMIDQNSVQTSTQPS